MGDVTRKDVEEIEYDRGPDAIPGIKFHAAARARRDRVGDERARDRGGLPLGDLVDTRFPIEAADAALAAAAERRALRPVVP
jgi:hypothetical protein